ncbi:hypothetical protein Msi02_04630 [Microbispora siamensis]|uniref:Uncharacterized protein n=1 Tax=Microbispora siamensis TaxID=564413 RepID=A0ABQ4GDZ9_9ACTN|nr:hypothetical protein Msi02_04630 [Microbispora siamensis]
MLDAQRLVTLAGQAVGLLAVGRSGHRGAAAALRLAPLRGGTALPRGAVGLRILYRDGGVLR